MFEFDPEKSKSNKVKHGIGFNEATRLWQDPERVLLPAKSLDEARFLLIGKVDSDYWSAIYTWREEKIRIISVRKARKELALPLEITPEVVADCLAKLEELLRARANFDKETGEWQDATQEKNRVLLELKEWMDDFDTAAKVALYDHPQLLEVLGIFVRS